MHLLFQNCVLDFLGKEVKAILARKKEKKDKPAKAPKSRKMIDMVSQDDDQSEVSALSEIDISVMKEDSSIAYLIDTSAMKLGEEEKTESSSKHEIAPPRSLMRRKSEEALDQMFKEAREENSNEGLSGDIDIDHIFNASNEYGLTSSRASRSMSGSNSYSGSSHSRNLKRKSKSRSTSVASMVSWGTNLEGKLPSVTRFECSLLFIDISGFTKLSTLLDPESLSKVNSRSTFPICNFLS